MARRTHSDPLQAIALLKDYTARMHQVRRTPQMRELLRDLARMASQMIEHTELDPLTLLELRLRLAEFEHALGDDDDDDDD